MIPLQLRFLGMFEVTVGETAVTSFRTDKMRALLAYLAINGDRSFRRDALAALLWPDRPDSDARRNLRQSFHRLRQALAAHDPDLEQTLFDAGRQEIQFNLSAAVVDVIHFQEQLQHVGRHNHGRLAACDDCLSRLGEAVGHYRGELLAGFSLKDAPPFEEWLLIQRQYLQQLLLETFQNLADAYEARSDYRQARDFAHHALTIAPWHESAHQQLMQLYLRQGQPAEAAAQYQRCVQVLAEELAVPPSPETERLYQQILSGKYETPLPPKTTLHHFPTQFNRFIGREAEVAQVVKQLTSRSGRLLTLHGLGGIGKTRLAIETAASLAESGQFTDLYFIPLAGIDTAETMITTIARSLSLTLDKRPSPHQQLVAFLRDKQFLMVLDNFEQLLESADFLAEVLNAAPQVSVLVTSREGLKLKAERQLSLFGLAVPPEGTIDRPEDYPALTLFERSVQRVRPNFVLDEETLLTAADICRLVEGMPLALEMVSAWVRLLDLELIAAKIKENLNLLTTSVRDAPERHQSMQAVFEYSWQFLTENQQQSLAQMSAFRGDFSLDAATTVTAVTLPDLAVLVDKSLVMALGNGRYGLHNLVRQYAAEKLSEQPSPHPEPARTALAHSRYYLALVANLETAFTGPTPHHAQAIVSQEIGNIYLGWETAVQRGDFHLLLPSIESLYNYYEMTGLFLEANRIFQQAIDRIKAVPAADLTEKTAVILGHLQAAFTRFAFETGHAQTAQNAAQNALAVAERYYHYSLKAKALYQLGILAWWDGKLDSATQMILDAYELFIREEDLPNIVRMALSLTFFKGQSSQYEAALDYGNQALKYAREESFIMGEIGALDFLGSVYESMLDLDQALHYQGQVGRLIEPMNLERRRVIHILRMGNIYYLLCDFPRALAYYEEHLALQQQSGNRIGMTTSKNNIAMVYEKLGKYELALSFAQKARDLGLETDNKWGLTFSLVNMGYVLNALGEPEKAMDTLQESLQLAQSFKAQKMVALILDYIGLVHLGQERFDQAEDFLRRALEIDQEISNRYGIAMHLCNQGHLMTILGKAAESLTGFAEAEQIQREMKDRFHLSQTLIWQAKAYHQLTDYNTAELLAQEGTRIAEEIGRPDMIVEGNTLLAEIMNQTGRALEGERFLEAVIKTQK